jgi:nucleotide-binding universal stress UspA family protein
MRVERGSPHRRLVEFANEAGAGVIVMGSRGRTGLAALGSVSERVTHHASCSVLIVRSGRHLPGTTRSTDALGRLDV